MEENKEIVVLNNESDNFELKENIMPVACSTMVDKIELVDSGLVENESVIGKSDLEVVEVNDVINKIEEPIVTCDMNYLLSVLNKQFLEMNNKFEKLDKNNLELRSEINVEFNKNNLERRQDNLELKTELKAEFNQSIAELRSEFKDGFNKVNTSLDKWSESLDNHALELSKETIISNSKDVVNGPKEVIVECRPSATQALFINNEILESDSDVKDKVVGIDLDLVNSEVNKDVCRPKDVFENFKNQVCSLVGVNKNRRLGLGKFKMKFLGIFFDNKNNDFMNKDKVYEFDYGALYNKNNFERNNNLAKEMIGRCFKFRKKKMKYLVFHENDYYMVYDLGFCFTVIEKMLWNILGCTDFNNGKIFFNFYNGLLNDKVDFRRVGLNGVMDIFNKEIEDFKYVKEVNVSRIMSVELRLGDFVSVVSVMLMFLKVIMNLLNFEVIRIFNGIFVLVLKKFFEFNSMKKDKSFYSTEELFKICDRKNFGFFDGNRKSINKVSTTVKFIKNIKV